jgi:phosphopantothenoylcysteine synthetase/decarboxylase
MAKILMGVTGSIAAYKTPTIASVLTKAGHDVHVVMTASAGKLVTVEALRTMSKNSVYSGDVFQKFNEGAVEHIELPQSCDLVLVAPASANTIGKMANGVADDMLSTMLLAVDSNTPRLIAPAMNTAMWQNPIVQANLSKLVDYGWTIIDPVEGDLACGVTGVGALAATSDIVSAVQKILS